MRIIPAFRLLLAAIVTSFALFSCNEKEEFTTEKLSEYMPLAPGKYITYRLDSLVITNFNKVIETHRYQLKEQVDAVITDNLGRPSYRVYRYLRDSTGTGPWIPSGTYMVTVLEDQVEVLEDNLRTIKLHLPLKVDFAWSGNKYYPNRPYAGVYTFNNDISIQDWQFTYDALGESFSYGNKTYSDVVTVEQMEEGNNIPVTLPGSYGYKTRSVEKYSKGIGQVYREYTLYDYQPGPNTYWGFGIKKWMIDHN